MATTIVLPADGETPYGTKLRTAITTVRDAADAAQTTATTAAANALLALGGATFVGDGVADDGPAFQAAYDAGFSPRLEADLTYKINTPVFFDRTDKYRSYTIDLNGSKILFGSGLPTTAAFYRDTTTKWAFFGNTNRANWNSGAGTVLVDDTSRSSGASVGNLMPVIFRNGTIAGAGGNYGLLFNNRAGAYFDRLILSGARTLYSWFDYSDVAIFIGCHNRKDTAVTASALLIQINSGDGVIFDGCKADGGILIANMNNCHGASIRSNVTGQFIFQDCSGIKFDGVHQENISDTVNIKSTDSHITFDRCVMYPARVVTVPMLEIADSTGFSNIALRDCNVHRLNASGSTADTVFGPLVSFTTVTDGTTLVMDNSFATDVSTAATSDGYLPGPFGVVTATGTAATALASALTIAAQAKMGTGSFRILKADGAWGVRNMDGTNAGVLNAKANPTMATTLDKLTGGALVSGTTYSYVCAVIDPAGRSTARSALVTAVMTASGTARLKITGSPGNVRIWRKAAATGADTSPTAYVDLGLPGGTMYCFDTGTNVGGEPWLTTSIPASQTTNDCASPTAYSNGAPITLP